MAKRFGEGVTLEDVESFAVNRTLAETRQAVKREEQEGYQELERIKVSANGETKSASSFFPVG